jgi:peptidoglycan/LPS O-acetylase OafA/YrhL
LRFWNALTDRVLEDTSTSGTKFSPLDGLRGIAVLVVFLSHASAFRQRLTPWTSFHGTGHLGVYLFFVLSGFLLTWSLLASPKVRFFGFYLRRFFRIAPLYYLILSAVFAIQLWTGRVDLYNLHIKGGAVGFLQHLAFYKGNSVFWTIAAEFEFYVILPFLVLALARWGGKAAMVYLVIIAGYGVWSLFIEMGRIDPRYSLKVADIAHHSQYLDVFLCGILAAWVFRKPAFAATGEGAHRGLHRLANVLAIAAIGISLALAAENIFGLGRHWRNEQSWWQSFGSPRRVDPQWWSIFFGPAFAVIALAALTRHRVFQTICDWRPLRLIGVTGFSWYLIHFPILRLTNAAFGLPPTAGGAIAWTWREPAAFASSFILTSLVAVVLYLVVEKPFMMMSRNFLKRRVPIPA